MYIGEAGGFDHFAALISGDRASAESKTFERRERASCQDFLKLTTFYKCAGQIVSSIAEKLGFATELPCFRRRKVGVVDALSLY